MSLTALFYVNGILEATTSYFVWTNPEQFVNNEKMDKNGKMWARRFSQMLGGFGIASILMAKQPDSEAKQLFSFGWLYFHAIVTLDRLRDKKTMPVIVHGCMTVWFIYYLYKTTFSTQVLSIK